MRIMDVGESGHGSKESGTVGDTLAQFSQDSSMHAVKYIADTKRPCWRRFSWILVFILLLAGCCFIILSQIMVIWQRPTLSKMTSQFRNTLHMPAITICNLNAMKLSYVTKDPLIRTVMNNINYEFNDSVFTEMSDELYQSINLTKYYEEGSVTLNETIAWCLFEETFLCNSHFTQINTEFGACFMINTSSSSNAKLFNSSRLGPSGGFKISINIHDEEYYKSQYDAVAGIKVMIHDPLEEPIPTMGGVVLNPGTQNFIGMEMKKAEYLPRPVQAFEDDYCLDTKADDFISPLKTTDRYSVEMCQYECAIESLSELCGCRLSRHKGFKSECDVLQTITCLRMLGYIQLTNNGEDKLKCNCPGPCETSEYRLSISSTDIASKSLVTYLHKEFPKNLYYSSLNLTYLRKNTIVLYVYYKSFVVEIMKQVEDYNVGDIFASVGGHLGLFLGASLATVAELLEALIMLLIAYCQKTMYMNNAQTTGEN